MSGLKIYGVPASRAYRTLWCAEELGLDYQSVPIHFADGTAKTPEYLAINPNGKIPAIVDGDFALWESMAINCYLAKKHDKGLWPKTLEGEALVLQWSIWAVAELEKPLFTLLMNSPRFARAEPDTQAARDAEAVLKKPLAVLDAALANSPYLLGAEFSVADLNLAALVAWGALAGLKFEEFGHVAKWFGICTARPAARRAAPKLG